MNGSEVRRVSDHPPTPESGSDCQDLIATARMVVSAWDESGDGYAQYKRFEESIGLLRALIDG